MQDCDLYWNVFKNNGSVEAYLGYRYSKEIGQKASRLDI